MRNLKAGSVKLSTAGDLEAVQSLLAMSQWSPPSPPQSESRTRLDEYEPGSTEDDVESLKYEHLSEDFSQNQGTVSFGPN